MIQFEPHTTRVGNSEEGKQIPITPPGHELVIPPTAITNCSGLFCPNIYLYDHVTLKKKINNSIMIRGPILWTKLYRCITVENSLMFIKSNTIMNIIR